MNVSGLMAAMLAGASVFAASSAGADVGDGLID
jgi:hypothetical protein